MEHIKIISTGKFLPEIKIDNKMLAQKYIEKRTGIRTRYYANEDIVEMAVKSAKEAIKNKTINIDLIIVASTTTQRLMPGISYLVQKELQIENCMCLDILAGCSGYINAFDIARNYIAIGKVKTAMIIGVDILSKYVNEEDIGTAIILSDGAGATVIQEEDIEKKYESNIKSDGKNSEILTCLATSKIYMDGKAVYKYAVTETVKNINELLEIAGENLDSIKYIIPHQSNLRILNSITAKLNIPEEKMFKDIQYVGNTFCASIPIALNEMFEKNMLQDGDKIILLGYGGGLNTGSILLEI